MSNAAIQLRGNEDLAIPAGLPVKETSDDVPEFEARSQVHILQNSTPGLRTVAKPEIAPSSAALNPAGDRQFLERRLTPEPPGHDRLLNARQLAEKLGVSERWVRDHTTRRSPKIRAVKLGTLIRYRRADVEVFMDNLDTSRPSRQPRFGV